MRKLAIGVLGAISGLHSMFGEYREPNGTAPRGVATEGKGYRKIILGGISEKIGVA